jgi:hypothetical protein
MSLRNLKAAPEEAMQLRRLINSSNESLGPYLFGGYSALKSPDLIGLKHYEAGFY